MKKILLVLILALLSGCSSSSPDKETLLRINNYSMSVEDFLNEVEATSEFYRSGKTKEELLEELIQKKLLLLEAQREGLDREGAFMETVEHFWEQGLLRTITEKKMYEFMNRVRVTEKEIRSRYADTDRESGDIRETIKREKISRKFDEWMAAMRRKASVYINKKALQEITFPGEE